MDWGKANRMSKVIKPDGKCFYLAIDHGYFQGPTHGLEKPGEVARNLAEFVDAIFVSRGVLRAQVDPKIDTQVILRVTGGESMVSEDLSNEELTTSIDDIVRLNAAAVGVSVYIGDKSEHQTIMNLTAMVNDCERAGIPVMAVTAVGRELERREARYLAMACRICAEMGASVVKTYYCEDFNKVIQGCPVPVVIAGGPKTESELEVLEFVYKGIQEGAIGVNLGRNIWQNGRPRAMARALQAVIHENMPPKQAHELYLSFEK
jgi:3-hydroxy-5-phosphonooxypentane-2,4-dione thiolase